MEEKLSNLVKYRSKVDDLSTDELEEASDKILTQMFGDLLSSDPGLEKEQQDLIKTKDAIFKNIKKLHKQLVEYQAGLGKVLQEKEQPYIDLSYKQYEDFQNDTPEYIQEAWFNLLEREDVKSHFMARIKNNTSSRKTGLFIRPESGEMVDPMVSCNPLYLMDEHWELLSPVKKLWTPQFQSRLCYRLTNENEGKHFRLIPKDQIGFMVVLNFFNYRPLDIIKSYLEEILEVLSPGGVCLFTYNNCDLPGAVNNVEHYMYTYTPGRIVKAMCEGIGFEIVEAVDYNDINVSWLEIKKPGKRTTLRAGQPMAKIIKTETDII